MEQIPMGAYGTCAPQQHIPYLFSVGYETNAQIIWNFPAVIGLLDFVKVQLINYPEAKERVSSRPAQNNSRKTSFRPGHQRQNCCPVPSPQRPPFESPTPASPPRRRSGSNTRRCCRRDPAQTPHSTSACIVDVVPAGRCILLRSSGPPRRSDGRGRAL